MGAIEPRTLYRPLRLAAAGVVYGLCVLMCGSFIEAVYLAAVPCFVVWAALSGRGVRLRPARRHLVYAGLLGALVAGYMVSYAGILRTMAVRWSEVAAAMYFLGALHVILWCLDAVVRAATGAVLGLRRADAARWRRTAQAALRVAAMVLVGGPLVAAALTTHWVKFADATDPAIACGLGYRQAGFYTADGAHIRGWYIPTYDALGGDTTVIVAPARGLGKASAIGQAKKLIDSGSNVLLIDLRGEGASDGHARGFGVSEAADISAAVDYLRAVHPRGSRQVFALGVSHGASAVLAAAATDRRIEAVVADSTPPSPREQIARATSLLPWPLGNYFREATLALASLQVGRDLTAEAATERLAWISPRPILLIHGQADAVMPVRSAERLYAAAGRPVMLWRVPQAGHGEPFFQAPDLYAQIVGKTLKSVRLGLPAFAWAPDRQF